MAIRPAEGFDQRAAFTVPDRIEEILREADERQARLETERRERREAQWIEVERRAAERATRMAAEAERARAMRCAGAKYREIAAALGCSLYTAYDRAARLPCTCGKGCLR